MNKIRWAVILFLLFVAVNSLGLLARDYLGKKNSQANIEVVPQVYVSEASRIPELGEAAEIPEFPNLGFCTIIAEFDLGHKVVTLCEQAEIVCIEAAYSYSGRVMVNGGNGKSFSCWDIEEAPKRIKELIKLKELVQRTRSSMDCGLGPC